MKKGIIIAIIGFLGVVGTFLLWGLTPEDQYILNGGFYVLLLIGFLFLTLYGLSKMLCNYYTKDRYDRLRKKYQEKYDANKSIIVNIDELILSQPDNGEQALEIVEMLASSEAVDIIVVDSVAALVPQVELEGGMSDSNVGAHARLMSKAMRKLVGVLSKSNCTVIFINQLREKVGVMYGNPEVTTGGRALKFYASIRIDIRKAEAIKDGDKILGNTVNIKVVKNKVAPPFKSCKVDLIFGEGFSKVGEVLDLAIENNLAKKSGSWFEILGERAGQGRDAAKQYLVDHQDVYEALVEQIYTTLGFKR